MKFFDFQHWNEKNGNTKLRETEQRLQWSPVVGEGISWSHSIYRSFKFICRGESLQARPWAWSLSQTDFKPSLPATQISLWWKMTLCDIFTQNYVWSLLWFLVYKNTQKTGDSDCNFFSFLFFFSASPVAHGHSQAGNWIWATAVTYTARATPDP